MLCCDVQDDVLLAYQIAFDLVENELQSFILKVGAGAEGLLGLCMVVVWCSYGADGKWGSTAGGQM